jgi:flagellar motor switch protein FliM
MVSVEGIPKYWATPGRYKGYTAVQVEENIEDPTEIIAIE